MSRTSHPHLVGMRGICDSHVHVIGPKVTFPLAAERTYTPPDATAESCRAMLDRTGAERVVLVQPSIYADDHRCLLHALDALGERARAVAVLPRRPAELRTLDDWARRGVRGLRLNVVTSHGASLADVISELQRLAAVAAPREWHVQLFVDFATLQALAPVLVELPSDIVLDHLSLAPVTGDKGQAACEFLQRLAASSRVWLKLSGFYKLAAEPPYAELAPLMQSLARTCPERLLWGSDWPHTPSHGSTTVDSESELPFREVDTAGLPSLLASWVQDPILLRQILVANPAGLYGFDPVSSRGPL